MDRRVAVKAIDPVLIGRQDVAARFEREVRALAALRHPNLVLAYDADAVGAIHFFVMELLEGEDLKRHVDRRGPLPFGAACRMMCTAAHALGAAHEEGIIHRDVKPRNLFLTKKGQLKVLDFGLASLRILEPERSVCATQSGVLLGTLESMAPEQLDEPATVDARADVFGLGCTLYFMITGISPFQRPSRRETLQALLNGDVASPVRLERGIPDPLGKYVLRMLSPEAADRPSTMDEVAEGLGAWLDAQDNSVARGDLARAAAEGGVARGSEHVRPPDIRSRYLEGTPITARRAGPVARELKSAKWNPALAATTLALLLAVGGLCGAVFTWSGSGISPLVADLGIIAMSISANDHVTTWYANGTVTKGSSWQLDAKWEPRPYSMPPGKEVGDILAIDVIKDTNWVYTWYKDGTVSCGISTELDMYWPPRPFAVRKGVKHVVGIGMVDDQQVYVYYDDGTLSCGSVTDLTARFGNDSQPYQHYSLPRGKSPRDILGIGISKEVKVYAWYRDGTASAGSFKKLDNLRPPYPFTTIRQADEP